MRSLILGGARSGKSALAERLAEDSGLEVVYIATAEAGDAEMQARIQHHRLRRPDRWRTVESPRGLADTLHREAGPGRCLLVDCLTLWLSNLLCDEDEPALEAEQRALLDLLPLIEARLILVSNEVGQGVVPMGALSRRFVDSAGRLHQALAAGCEQVLWVAAGLPLALKGTSDPFGGSAGHGWPAGESSTQAIDSSEQQSDKRRTRPGLASPGSTCPDLPKGERP